MMTVVTVSDGCTRHRQACANIRLFGAMTVVTGPQFPRKRLGGGGVTETLRGSIYPSSRHYTEKGNCLAGVGVTDAGFSNRHYPSQPSSRSAGGPRVVSRVSGGGW